MIVNRCHACENFYLVDSFCYRRLRFYSLLKKFQNCLILVIQCSRLTRSPVINACTKLSDNFFSVCTAEELSPGQTIATCQRNMSQHCWAQPVACVWPPCCDVLRHVGCCWLKSPSLHPSTPSLHHSITPSLHHSITPSLHHSITPSLHHSITPSLHHSITPSLHHSITPSLHHSITPSLHHSITPSLHHSITPSLHHSITPSLHHSITPSLHHFPLDIWKPGGASI